MNNNYFFPKQSLRQNNKQQASGRTICSRQLNCNYAKSNWRITVLRVWKYSHRQVIKEAITLNISINSFLTINEI